MWILIAGLVIFFAVHLSRAFAPGFRAGQIASNEGRWKGIYSLVSLLGFALIVWGWIVYRQEAPQVFDPPSWARHIAWVLVPISLIFVAAAYQPVGYIKKTLKHPFLAGVIVWAAAHLLANGDLASLLLFGGFLAYGIVDRIAVIPRGDPAPAVVSVRGDIVAIVLGLVLSAILVLFLHQWLFGVSPIG